jgi:hypothetical protein
LKPWFFSPSFGGVGEAVEVCDATADAMKNHCPPPQKNSGQAYKQATKKVLLQGFSFSRKPFFPIATF